MLWYSTKRKVLMALEKEIMKRRAWQVAMSIMLESEDEKMDDKSIATLDDLITEGIYVAITSNGTKIIMHNISSKKNHNSCIWLSMPIISAACPVSKPCLSAVLLMISINVITVGK